jgi:hypothetical protein
MSSSPFFSFVVVIVLLFSFMHMVSFLCMSSSCVSFMYIFMCSVCPFFIVVSFSVMVVLILCMLNFFVASRRWYCWFPYTMVMLCVRLVLSGGSLYCIVVFPFFSLGVVIVLPLIFIANLLLVVMVLLVFFSVCPCIFSLYFFPRLVVLIKKIEHNTRIKICKKK